MAAILDDEKLREKARISIEGFGSQWSEFPRSMPLMLVAASRFLESDQQIVVVGELKSEAAKGLIRVAHRWRKPYSVLIGIDSELAYPEIFEGNQKLQLMFDSNSKDGLKVYVCENYTCREPVSTAAALESVLQ